MTRVRHDPSTYDDDLGRERERAMPEETVRSGSYYQSSRHDPTMREGSMREGSYDGPLQDQRSLGELIGDLSRETRTLLRQEMQLATLELKKRAAEAGRNAAFVGAGSLILYAGFLALMATAIVALAQIMELWLAALIVGIVVMAVGAYLLYHGYSRLNELDMVPRRTVETLQENAEWLKQEVS